MREKKNFILWSKRKKKIGNEINSGLDICDLMGEINQALSMLFIYET